MTFSYTISPFLKSELDEIDARRAKILLTPLSPREEMKIKWSMILNRISYSLRLQNVHVKKSQIPQVLTSGGKKKLNPQDWMIIQAKNAYDYLYQEWLGSADQVSTATIVKLWSFISQDSLKFDQEKLSQSLSFLQVKPEHPVTQAALGQILILSSFSLNPETEALSRLVSQLFLYKHCYDFRGFLVIEDYFIHNLATYQETIENSLRAASLSGYLEYFAEIIITESDKIIDNLSRTTREAIYPESYFELTTRQKEILGLFDDPAAKITNRDVQKAHSVSQITASRDLSRLTSLNLIYPHGKGRSVYYTKA